MLEIILKPSPLSGPVKKLSSTKLVPGAKKIGVGFPGGSPVKNPPPMQKMLVQFPDQEDPLEKEMTTHSSILVWKIPWTEDPGGLQSMGSQRVGHDLVTKQLQQQVGRPQRERSDTLPSGKRPREMARPLTDLGE